MVLIWVNPGIVIARASLHQFPPTLRVGVPMARFSALMTGMDGVRGLIALEQELQRCLAKATLATGLHSDAIITTYMNYPQISSRSPTRPWHAKWGPLQQDSRCVDQCPAKRNPVSRPIGQQNPRLQRHQNVSVRWGPNAMTLARRDPTQRAVTSPIQRRRVARVSSMLATTRRGVSSLGGFALQQRKTE